MTVHRNDYLWEFLDYFLVEMKMNLKVSFFQEFLLVDSGWEGISSLDIEEL